MGLHLHDKSGSRKKAHPCGSNPVEIRGWATLSCQLVGMS